MIPFWAGPPLVGDDESFYGAIIYKAFRRERVRLAVKGVVDDVEAGDLKATFRPFLLIQFVNIQRI